MKNIISFKFDTYPYEVHTKFEGKEVEEEE